MNITPDIEASEKCAVRKVAKYPPARWVLTAVREAYGEPDAFLVDTADKADQYWREQIETDPTVSLEVEQFVVLLVNTRRRVKGHVVCASGTLDTILVHPREVFRAAIIGGAAAIIVMHNHPSGEPSPSEADIKVTRDLTRAGHLLKIEVLDHVIIGAPGRKCSLRENGYFS